MLQEVTPLKHYWLVFIPLKDKPNPSRTEKRSHESEKTTVLWQLTWRAWLCLLNLHVDKTVAQDTFGDFLDNTEGLMSTNVSILQKQKQRVKTKVLDWPELHFKVENDFVKDFFSLLGLEDSLWFEN